MEIKNPKFWKEFEEIINLSAKLKIQDQVDLLLILHAIFLNDIKRRD